MEIEFENQGILLRCYSGISPNLAEGYGHMMHFDLLRINKNI